MSIHQIETLFVNQVMMKLEQVPVVQENVILKVALEDMGRSNLGIVCIVNSKIELLGILTDGDLRRKLLKIQKPFSSFFVDDALDHAVRSPVTILPSDTLLQAVGLMGRLRIWDLPVVDCEGHLVGLLHLHPAIQALIGMDE